MDRRAKKKRICFFKKCLSWIYMNDYSNLKRERNPGFWPVMLSGLWHHPLREGTTDGLGTVTINLIWKCWAPYTIAYPEGLISNSWAHKPKDHRWTFVKTWMGLHQHEKAAGAMPENGGAQHKDPWGQTSNKVCQSPNTISCRGLLPLSPGSFTHFLC